MKSRLIDSLFVLCVSLASCAPGTGRKVLESASPETCSFIAEVLTAGRGQTLTETASRTAALACDENTRELYCTHAPASALHMELCGE